MVAVLDEPAMSAEATEAAEAAAVALGATEALSSPTGSGAGSPANRRNSFASSRYQRAASSQNLTEGDGSSPKNAAPGLQAMAAAEDATRDTAARVIQRCAKNMKIRRMFPSMEKLRSLFMDERALAAGAADSVWYKPAALAIREALRTAPEVVQALNDAWEACSAAADSPKELTMQSYSIMCRKMYLADKIDDADSEIDPKDCLDTIAEYWADDTGGQSALTEELFKRCWFQLADLNVDTVGADEYAEWL